MSKMPEKFFWGNSTSSMQTEGGWDEGGKGPSVYDERPIAENLSDWKVAIDNYHNYVQDFDLMAEMGMTMYRFQISWSRVVPDGEGSFNEEGIQFYSKMIDALLARGIEPMICLYHFDMPLALARKYNGFVDRRVTTAFVRFGQEMIRRFADRVKYWIVFNEHNLYFTSEAFKISGYEVGDKTLSELYQIFHHTMLAHCELVDFAHQNFSDLKVGGMLACTEIYPATPAPADNFAVRKQEEFLMNHLCDVYAKGRYSEEVLAFVESQRIDMGLKEGDAEILSKGLSDFIAFSYYRSGLLDSSSLGANDAPNLYLEKGFKLDDTLPATEWGWSIDALGFRSILTRLYSRYGLPVFPIENGIGLRENWDGQHTIEDDLRVSYHRDHVQALKDAYFLDGVDILGYLGWGLIDIPSSQGDMEKRYGVVYVNRGNRELRDMKRVPKKSFYWFKRVFESRGEDLDV